MKVWWCVEHLAQIDWSGSAKYPMKCWLQTIQTKPTCRAVEKSVVSPIPTGYLVYGEYIPYDIWLKHLPFAAPTDQVVALYAEEGT